METEATALATLAKSLDAGAIGETFVSTIELIAKSRGRIVVTGMGKSGLIGRKVSATLSSTGTPSFYLHPAEASHGDLGMIIPGDILLAFSWSGETGELHDVLTYCDQLDVPVVAITSRDNSTLARFATLSLVLPDVLEACPHRLAPTSSTTVQAALGDALAVALLEARGFSTDDFRRFHPRGTLGVHLLSVGDLMAIDDHVPKVTQQASILEAMMEMSQKRYGVTAVVDHQGGLVGAFTDGDLRRSLTFAGVDAPVRDHMTSMPLSTTAEVRASRALAMMNERNISQLFVCQEDRLVGILHLHDMLRAGVH